MNLFDSSSSSEEENDQQNSQQNRSIRRNRIYRDRINFDFFWKVRLLKDFVFQEQQLSKF